MKIFCNTLDLFGIQIALMAINAKHSKCLRRQLPGRRSFLVAIAGWQLSEVAGVERGRCRRWQLL